MPFLEDKTTWNNIIQFNKDGFTIASYPKLKNAILERFKEIYGQDIDVSTTTADGIYVETLSLMINNILQAFKFFYEQLDVNTASGKFLDALCGLSNVYRKPETYSTAKVKLTLDEFETQDFITNEIELLDKNGNTWRHQSNRQIVFKPGKVKELVFTCTNIGPIRARKGTIDKLVSNDVVMNIVQDEDAVEGSYEESDNSLRARRNASLGATGNTVLETLAGSLYTISGIDDVKIYNNDTNTSITAKDSTSIPAHQIYIILRQKQNIDVDDILVGNTIYEKLTPGVLTTQSAVSSDRHQIEYVSKLLGLQEGAKITQNVYWKVATPVKPLITVKLDVYVNYASADNEQSQLIVNNVISYLNNLQLSSKVYINDIWNIVVSSDKKFRGQSTFSIKEITIAGSVNQIYQLKDTYFRYQDSDVNIQDDSSVSAMVSRSSGTGTVTISIGE